MTHLIRSLALTALFSFSFPILLVSSLLTGLWLVSLVPLVSFVGQCGTSLLLQFLIIFGDGSALPGLLIIGATCSLVGGVFDLFNHYLYQDVHHS